MTRLMDCLLRGEGERIYLIGQVHFPFLPGEEQREMFYGLYEPMTVKFMEFWLRSGDIFIDVGSNIGYLSAIALNCVGIDGSVHAFEPEPKHFERLSRLMEVNPGYKITINCKAVSDQDGMVTLYISPHAGWHTIIRGFNQDCFGVEKEIDVSAVTLDSYVTQHRLNREPRSIRLVKIDVEGSEAAVLRGAKRLISQRDVDAFLVEVTPPNEFCPAEPLVPIFEYMDISGYVALALNKINKKWKRVAPENILEQTMVLWTREELEKKTGFN